MIRWLKRQRALLVMVMLGLSTGAFASEQAGEDDKDAQLAEECAYILEPAGDSSESSGEEYLPEAEDEEEDDADEQVTRLKPQRAGIKDIPALCKTCYKKHGRGTCPAMKYKSHLMRQTYRLHQRARYARDVALAARRGRLPPPPPAGILAAPAAVANEVEIL